MIAEHLSHDDAMIRRAGLEALGTQYTLGNVDFEQSANLAYPLLDDEVRLVRMEAARILAPIDQDGLEPEDQEKLHHALQEYIDGQLFNSERPESQVNLGNLYHSMNDSLKAEKAFRQALKLQPKFVPAWINLAQFYSVLNREKDALQTLQMGLEKIPDSADIHHAVGLAQVRFKLLSEAVVSLEKAALLAPENAYYYYVYGIAVNSYQGPEAALQVLNEAHQLHPENMDILMALFTINQENGHIKDALSYAEKIIKLEPDNVYIKNFILQLEKIKN